MNFQDAVRTCFQKYANLSGRARRSEFWFFWLFNLLVQLAAALVDGALLGGGSVLGGILSLALLLPAICVAGRRLHDTGRSAWWLLIGLVPVIGLLVLIYWYISRGEDGPNAYGPDPRGGIRAA